MTKFKLQWGLSSTVILFMSYSMFIVKRTPLATAELFRGYWYPCGVQAGEESHIRDKQSTECGPSYV